MNRIFYFFIFILGITSNLHAVEPFTVTDEVACLPLLNHLEYYEDTEGKLSITEIANQSFQWRPVNTDSINIGISQSAHWFRFSIENKQKSVKELYLNLTSGFINYVNFYLSQETDTFQKISAGNKLPSSTQDIASKNFVFRIPADPGYHTYYLRIQSNNPIIFEMQICSPEAYIEKTTQELPLLWIYFGMMLALAIYNLFYFVSVRQVIYLYCFALIALNALSRYYLTGFGFQYLWPDSIWFQSRASYLFDTGAMFFTSCYYRSLFRTRAKYPIFEKLLLWISLFPAPLLLVVFSVLEPRQVMPIALIIWIFLNLIIYLLLLIHAAMKKSRQATIILFGFSVAFIFYFNVMLKIFGFSVVNVTTAMGLSIGDVIHSIFLSFALADTINTMKKKLVNLNRALNESQKNYRLISENISDVISIIDLKDLKFKYVSPSIQRVLGYTSTEILGSSIDKVLPAKLFNEFNHNFNQFLTLQKEGNWDFNEPTIVVFKINRKDGNAIWIEVVSNIVQWNGVEYGGLLAITRDITARKQAEEEIKKLNLELEERVKARTEELRQAVAHAQKLARKAEAANIEKSRFLANMSHEIRTPMNGVIGFTDMLLDTELTDDQLDYIKTIKRSGESLLFLINDILDFSKIESGELDFEEIDFDPELLAYDVCELVRPKIVSKPIELLCHIHDQLPHVVKGDPLRFRQVLTNLLGNAPKFTEQGEIELSLTIEDETEDEVKLHTFIRDTGIGIAQDKLQSIFDPFQQADDSTTRKYGGTGLGLSICRKIAVMMKGDTWVDSVEGKGSTFHFTAWLKKSEKQPAQRMKPVTLAQKRVLVVDDNPINLEILEKMLEKVAMEVITLTRGTDVIPYLKDAIAKNNIIDIAVLDIEIPDMDGYSIAAAIREPNQQFPSIPLVALSSVMKRDAQKCETAGFNGFLSKPVRPDKLYQMLERLLAETSGTQVPSSERKAKIHTQYSVREDIKQSICILLAEDNPVNQKLAVMMLGKAGYKVEVAVNGIEAVEKYSAAPENFDLIFMDVQMPEMDGVAASQSLRQKGFDKVPIVAMTANAMKGDREKCLAAGMNDYMTKPIKREKVFEMVEKWCFMPPSYFQ